MTGKMPIERRYLGLVDVKSVAQAHLNAINLQEAADQRFFLINGAFKFKDFAEPLKE
jgi:nucleoside-diphosphate-sugar epimerase